MCVMLQIPTKGMYCSQPLVACQYGHAFCVFYPRKKTKNIHFDKGCSRKVVRLNAFLSFHIIDIRDECVRIGTYCMRACSSFY